MDPDVKRIDRLHRYRFRNWAQTYHARPELLWKPRSIDEVQAIVRYARATGRKVRAIGAGHSPSDLCCTEGYMISLERLNRVLKIDRTAKTATFQAGRWMRDCHDILREHGLRFPVLGSISAQSLAGTISTASHGYGWNAKCFSSLVQSILLVCSDGTLKSCSPRENSDLFDATLCGLGATGIIVELTIECCEDSLLEEESFAMDVQGYIDAILGIDGKAESGIFNSAQHVRAYWYPQVGRVKVQRTNVTKKDLHVPSAWQRFLYGKLIGRYMHQIGLLISRYIPSYLFFHARFIWYCLENPGRLPRGANSQLIDEGKSWRRISTVSTEANVPELIFNYDCGPRQYTFECAVPIERAPEAIQALRSWLENEYRKWRGLRHHFPLEMRVAAGDDIWLSPAHAGRVLWIGIMQYKPFGLVVPYKKLFRQFERITLAHEGRAHWAKAHEVSRHDLEKSYPALSKWREVRDAADPEGVFLNAYVLRHLYGRLGERYDLKRWKSSVPYWQALSV